MPMNAEDRATHLEMWSEQVNSAVVRVPGRRFPGVVVQGDSLSVLYDLAMCVVEHLPTAADTEVRHAAKELAEQLLAHLKNYEGVLGSRGVDPPYRRDPSRVPGNLGGEAG